MRAQIVNWKHYDFFCKPKGQSSALLIPSENLMAGMGPEGRWQVETGVDIILRGFSRYSRIEIIREIEISEDVVKAFQDILQGYQSINSAFKIISDALRDLSQKEKS